MRKKLSKITSVCLAVIMIVSVLTVAPISVSAAVNDSDFANAISNLKKSFVDGQYWNKYNSSDYSHTGSIPCTGSSGGVSCVNRGYCGYNGYCTCLCGAYVYGGVEKAWQCLGFACKLGYSIFGTDPYSWGKHTNASNLKPGDIVYGNLSAVMSGATTHAIFITGVSGSNVTYADCNSAGPCKVKWGRTTTISAIQSAINNSSKSGMYGYISHASNNSTNSGTSSHTHNYNIKTYRWKSHPHYQCYQCSCGDVKENRNEPIPVSDCSQCLAEYKTTSSINKSTYILGEDVAVSWEKRNNATHYNVVLYKKNSAGEYKWYKTEFEYKGLSYKIPSLPVGEYYVFVQTYNSNYWTVDNSDWFHADGDKMYFTIVDNVLPDSIVLDKTNTVLVAGKTVDIKSTIAPNNATNKTVTWSSSNTSVATVDSNGKITAKSAGTATITAKTANGKTATCTVTVKPPQSERIIDDIKLLSQSDISIGQEIDIMNDLDGFEFEISYTDGSKETVTYYDNCLSNEYVSYSVIGISWSGETYEAGENIISISVDGMDYFDISIYAKDSSISGIEITQLPDKTEYTKDVDEGSVDLSGLEMQISYTDGTSKIYREDESYLYDEDELISIIDYKFIYEMPLGKNIIQLDYHGWRATFEINVVEDPYIKNPPVKIEVTKLPDKTFTNAVDPKWIDYEVNGKGSVEEISGIDYLTLCNDYLINKNMKGTEITVYYKDGTNKVFKIKENCTLQGNASRGLYFWEEENGRYFFVSDIGNYKAEVSFGEVETTFSVDDSNDDTIKVTGIELINEPVSPPSFEYYDYTYENIAVSVRGAEILIHTASGINLGYALGVPDYTTSDENIWTAYYSGHDSDMFVVTYFKSTKEAQIEYKGFTAEFTPCVAIFEPVDPTLIFGDVDGDGKVSIDDVTDIQKHLANMVDFTDEQEAIADVDNDGKVTIDDVTLIQKYLAGMISFDTKFV